MSQVLPQDVQAFVDHAVSCGQYSSEAELLAQAVRVLREVTERHQALREDILEAIAELDADRGEPWDAEALKAELDRDLDTHS